MDQTRQQTNRINNALGIMPGDEKAIFLEIAKGASFEQLTETASAILTRRLKRQPRVEELTAWLVSSIVWATQACGVDYPPSISQKHRKEEPVAA